MPPNPRLQDLGELTGKVLLFGGPVSNAQATRAMLDHAGALGIGPGNRICTGDAVAYCADPVATIEALDGQCAWLAGNCEKQLSQGAADCGCGFEGGSACDLLSRGWYAHAQAQLRPKDRARMAACPDLMVFRHAGRRYVVVHGGFTAINRFLWPDSDAADFQAEMDAMAAHVGPFDAVVAGHCGMAFIRRIGATDWINAGAVGMPPHDGRRDTRYVVLDDAGQARILRLSYDAAAAAAAMRAAGLTKGYDRALETGFWPSEDVLPPSMRS